MLAVVAVPVIAVVPLDGVRAAVVGAVTGATTPAPKPVAPLLQTVVVTQPTGAVHAATATAAHDFSTDTNHFATVSASWDDHSLPSGATLQVETRSGGTWSSWQDLAPTDQAPDPGTADARAAAAAKGGKVVSDPVWVGDADGVRLRLTTGGALPAGLQLQLINPGTSAADADPAAAATAGDVAHAASVQPQIYSRADWGADESLRAHNPGCGTPDYTSTIKAAFVHHTATSNDYTEDQVPSLLRAIYAYHVLSNGWCDIGYNFVIDRFGRIWEGRYGGIDQPVLGAHTGGFNANSFGVAFLGTFQTPTDPGATPTPEMLNALERLLSWKLGMYGRDPLGTTTLVSAGGSDTRFPRGQTVTFNVISGHRDAGDTTCPGDLVYNQLPTIRQATAVMMLGAALVGPQLGSDVSSTSGPIAVTSGMLQQGNWQLVVTNASGATVRTISGSGSSIQTSWDRTDDNGRPVPNGSYRLTLISNQAGIDAIPWGANVTLGHSIGGINQAFSATPGRLTVQGWSLRDGTPDAEYVRVVVTGGFSGTFLADMPRSDIAAQYPGFSAYRGFDATVPAAPGAQRVCVYGVNVGIADTLLGCAGVNVLGPAQPATEPRENPRGSLDSAVVPTPGKVQIRGWALDPDTKGSIRSDVYVDGHGLMPLIANQSRPDIARIYAGFGDRHGFSATLSLAGGTHQICIYGINDGAGSGNPAIACKTVNLPTGPPRGSYDLAAMTGLGKVLVRGWALDPDTVDPVRIDFYADGHGLTSVQADGVRPDIAAAYPMYGAKHGFQTTLNLAGGTHSICAFAINIAGGGNTLLGCRTVTLPTGSPKGAVDAATVTAPGQVQLRGWALDPDVADSVRIDVYVDGKGATSVQATDNRPDIARLFPLYGADHGFHTTLKLAGGTHSICLFAINIAGGGNTLLGCHTVTLPTGSAYGSFDSVRAVGPGQVEARGWAIDPDTADPVRVDFYVDGKGAASVTAGNDRADIAKLFPMYGSAHGFDATFSAPSGKHTVCAYAINVGGGAASTQLACLAVTVP